MQYHQLGSSQLTVSRIGYGAMVLSPGMYGAVNDDESLKTLEYAIDRGVNLIDTARLYGGGGNEVLIAKAIQGKRDRVIIATKGGLSFKAAQMQLDGSPQELRTQLEASLNSLNIETIDLYYLHAPDPKVPVADSIGEMAKFVQEGKVRYLGISNMSLDQIRTAHTIHPIAASQDQYSLFYRQCEGDGRLALLRELGIALVAYSPLGNGILGGAKPGLEANDFRTNLPRFQGEQLDRNLALSERFQSLARSVNLAPATLALAWLLHQGQDIFPIPGTRKTANLQTNIDASEVVLDRELLIQLDRQFPLEVSMSAMF
jgi:aryl-alcohol dehydrogenase-like predicted oxidoreductase